NRQYTMRPGESQWLETTYEITFHRGGQFGTARYSLPPGTYEFVVTDRGWDLKRRTYEVTIDNSRYPGSFGYTVGTQQFTLQPCERRSPQTDYPLVVVCGRGDGGQPPRKRLRPGTYQVGIDVHHARLDLFPATQPSSLLSGDFSDDPALSLGAEDL